MSEKRIWAMGSPPSPYDQLQASMSSLHRSIVDDYAKSIADDFKRAEPYRWKKTDEQVVKEHDYRGETITEKVLTWAPPEKQPENNMQGAFSLMYGGGKPDGLRDDNTAKRFVTKDWAGESKIGKWFSTLAKAKAYVDENLSIEANADALKPIVKFLKHDMPCTCGEHGLLSDREYLEKAHELFLLLKKNT